MTRLVRTLVGIVSIATALSLGSAEAQGAPNAQTPAKAQPAGKAQPAQPSTPAQAGPSPADKARARELYAQGQQLFRQGDYAGAQAAFEDAFRAVPNPVVLLSIAECQVRSERFLDAVLSLQRYLDERPDAPDKAQVEAQIEKLRQRPGIVTVESTPAGAAIFVDGVDTGKLTPADVELQSGDHRIAVELSGFQHAEQVLTVLIGSRQTVTLALPEVAKPTEPEPAPQAAEQPEETHGVGKWPVWVATGVAGAGLVTGIVLGSLALKEKSDFDETPTQKTADKGERYALFADVGFGIAVAAGVTALVLHFTGKDEKATPKQALSFKPQLSANRLGLVGNLRF